jgi:hypothetical protein
MGLASGKHIEKEIDGELQRIVETGITDKNRIVFLTKILEENGYEVKSGEEPRKKEDMPVTFMVGVSDMTFNPVLAVYGRRLFTKDGHRITPDYWNQKNDGKNEFDPNYWDYHKKPWFKVEGEK